MNFRRLIFLLTMTCLLTACGQRGPLFLPEETAAPAASQTAPDELDEDEEEVEDGSGADQKPEDKVHSGGFEDGRANAP